ncbi:hypothetical protein HMSSN139_68320 [Paenibacillus sp. HMSSN-139]|nr:hypothetical protein HMSSN139_68320 [Paenibacillus sp. HMSSN-139]
MDKTQEPRRKDRDFRAFKTFELRSVPIEGGGEELIVDGYAATFDQPTIMYEWEGVEYKEVIARGAFDGADMSDVIFNYNHSGKVMARTRNKTLQLNVDDRGLHVMAMLHGTQEGRSLYEEINGGYVDRMSFAFTVAEDSYDRDTHTRTILRFKKIYDVSAVDIPAYDTTSISARSFFELERDKEHKAAEAAQLRKKLILQTYL